jgi:hypothetical protein
MSKNETKKATESKIECPDCHSMILKTNLAAHKKTKRHQNAVNPLPSEDSKAAQRAKERLKKVTVRDPSYSEEDDDIEDEHDEVDDLEHDDDIEDMTFEDEVMAGLELLNNKLDQILALDMGSELRKCNVKFADLVKEMNELSRQSKENTQTTTNLLDNIRINVIQEIKACQGGQVQFNTKTG